MKPDITLPSPPFILRQPVSTTRVSAICQQPSAADFPCGGSLIDDGFSKPVLTPLGPSAQRRLYRHVCSSCGAFAWFLESYPQYQYMPLESTERKAE